MLATHHVSENGSKWGVDFLNHFCRIGALLKPCIVSVGVLKLGLDLIRLKSLGHFASLDC